MNDSPSIRFGLVSGLAALGLTVVAQQNLPKPNVSITEKDGFRLITSNGIPDHQTGQFPNANNPNQISPQNHSFRVTLDPKPSQQNRTVQGQDFGVAINGIPFDPSTAEFWNRNPEWNYEAMTGHLNLGVDQSNAHVQPTGAYHYHGIPTGLIESKKAEGKPTLVGWAADGYPIYGPLGYKEANNSRSGLKTLKPSYRLKAGNRPSRPQGPGGTYDGTFTADWEYWEASGDLDAFNGRTGVTPEFPKGTYYYVLTSEFPFIPRIFKGTPDRTFDRMGPPPGRFGGPPGPPPRRGGSTGGESNAS